MASPPEMIGICRWSYPSTRSGFRGTTDDVEEARAQLYAPWRMEHRLFLLEHVFVPCLAAQSDKNFKMLLLMGDQLPQTYRDRALNLIKSCPQIVPVIEEEGQRHDVLCRKIMNAHRDPKAEVSGQFRLDDDDAVGVNFIKTSREIFEEQRKTFERSGLFGLDFCRGFKMETTRDDLVFQPVTIRFWTPGMVVFLSKENNQCVMNFHHLQLWKKMPVLIWLEEPMFIRGVHESNDSNMQRRRVREFKLNARNPKRFMKRVFGIDTQTIRNLWLEHNQEFHPLQELSKAGE